MFLFRKTKKRNNKSIGASVLFVIFITFATIATSCNKETDIDSGTSTDVIIGEKIDISMGDHIVGDKIKEGFYNIKIVSGNGKVVVKDDNGDIAADEIMTGKAAKFRIVLSEGYEIQVPYGINLRLEPTPTPKASKEMAKRKETILYSGFWYVGKDIAPGKYKVWKNKSPNSSVGIVNSMSKFKVNNKMARDKSGLKEFTIELEDGDIIKIDNSDGIYFTQQ